MKLSSSLSNEEHKQQPRGMNFQGGGMAGGLTAFQMPIAHGPVRGEYIPNRDLNINN